MVKRSKTSPFHGENMGSNPVGVTKEKIVHIVDDFFLCVIIFSCFLLWPKKVPIR